MKWLIASALALAAAVIITRQRMADAQPDEAAPAVLPEGEPFFTLPDFSFPSLPTEWPAWTGFQSSDDQPDQLATPLEDLILTTQNAASNISAIVTQRLTGAAAPAPVDQGTAAANERAFLDMIAYAEGTSGPNGYRTLFGGGLFSDFADHPRQRFQFTNSLGQQLTTTAAGRYQFLIRTWDALAAKLGLPDFGPDSQDLAALELIRERGALPDVQAGRVPTAIGKVAKVWASLPGAGYAQPERKLTTLIAQYRAAGGNLEA